MHSKLFKRAFETKTLSVSNDSIKAVETTEDEHNHDEHHEHDDDEHEHDEDDEHHESHEEHIHACCHHDLQDNKFDWKHPLIHCIKITLYIFVINLILGGLIEFLGEDISENELYSRVMCMEQLMSTGGGWQDQVGGLVPGFKYLTTKKVLFRT